jgi:peptide/nickel transport system substrate-binding protein/oligopeptide transport system substrate-binding protein
MKSGKKITLRLLPGLLAALALLLVGCNSGGTSATVVNNPPPASQLQQIYRMGIVASDINSFDPGIATDKYSVDAVLMVFTGLVQLNDQLEVTPQLASSYQLSPDHLTYTFYLQHNLKFSDGTSLTSQDVAYSIDRALSPTISQRNSVTATYLGQIKDASKRLSGKKSSLIGDSINIIDPYTISLTLSTPSPYFLRALTYPTSFVVEKSVIDKWGSKWTDHLSDNGGQGGAGPFVVKNYDHTTGIQLIPNPRYYGPKPKLQEVDMNFYKTPEASYAAYQQGDLEQSSIPPQYDAQVESKGKEFHAYNELAIDYIAMNYLYKPFDDLAIRQAFALAINKDSLSKSLYNGLNPATCHIIPQGMLGYNPKLTCPAGASTRGDAAKAQALFQQGMQEENLTLATFPSVKITYESNSPLLDDEISVMRNEWRQVLGVTVNVQVVGFNSLLTMLGSTACTKSDLTKCQNKGLQMWAFAWGADYPDPQDWTSLQFGKGAANNVWNYGQNLCTCAGEQQAVQQQMATADTDLGPDRISLYQQAEQQLVNDVAWLPMFQRTGTYALKPYVTGIIDNPASETPPNDWSRVYIAVHS